MSQLFPSNAALYPPANPGFDRDYFEGLLAYKAPDSIHAIRLAETAESWKRAIRVFKSYQEDPAIEHPGWRDSIESAALDISMIESEIFDILEDALGIRIAQSDSKKSSLSLV